MWSNEFYFIFASLTQIVSVIYMLLLLRADDDPAKGVVFNSILLIFAYGVLTYLSQELGYPKEVICSNIMGMVVWIDCLAIGTYQWIKHRMYK